MEKKCTELGKFRAQKLFHIEIFCFHYIHKVLFVIMTRKKIFPLCPISYDLSEIILLTIAHMVPKQMNTN